jgi:hypothetical protein
MSEKNIIVRIHDEPKIIVKFGKQGLQGPMGPTGPTGPTGPASTTNHALLTNLDYNNAGHIGFQKQLVYVPDFKCYEIE